MMMKICNKRLILDGQPFIIRNPWNPVLLRKASSHGQPYINKLFDAFCGVLPKKRALDIGWLTRF